MISPELLRRFPFFSGLNDPQLREIAMAAEEIVCEKGTVLFEEGELIQALYFLVTGSVELYYAGSDDQRDLALVCEICPGQPFGISAMIEPHTLVATARVAMPSHILKIDAERLHEMSSTDNRLGFVLMQQIAKVCMERLHCTRLILATTQAQSRFVPCEEQRSVLTFQKN
jgi:CRP-like cAMP-binding protein